MQRRELLKLSKVQLIKRCKKSKLPTNGSKGDLVNRLIQKSSKHPNTKTSKKKSSIVKKPTKKKKHIRQTASTGALHFNAKKKKFKIKKVQTHNKEIIAQLIQFNYDRKDILLAINNVIDKNDINAIMNYIDTKIKHKIEPEEIKYNNYKYNDSDDNSSLSMLSIVDDDQYNNNNHINNNSDDDYEPKPSTPSNHSSIEDEKQIIYDEEKDITTDQVFELNNISVSLDVTFINDDDTLNLLSPSKQILTPSKRSNTFSKTPRAPKKYEIVQDLKEMGFTMDRILRAFKVYEKNYGTKYNTNGLIELITRLKMKDDENNKITEEKINMIQYDMNIFNIKHKSRKSNSQNIQMKPRLFVPHMSLVEAEKLCLFDNIDHRDFTGKFCVATIIDIGTNNSSNVKIHYEDDFNDKYDIWSDYKNELFRFAKHRSISRSKRYLFTDELKIGDHVSVKPHTFYLNEAIVLKSSDKIKWFDGIVTAFDKKSAQIQISHQNSAEIDQSNKHAKWFIYWTHIDNIQEVSKYSEKSLLPSSFYKYTHQKQSASLGSIGLGSVSLFSI